VTQPPPTPLPRVATRRRRDELLAHVRAGNGDINRLAERFGVSLSTIRRDLAALAGAGHLLRTYGGAATPGHFQEPSLRAKQSAHPDEKDAIGKHAASLVTAGDLLLLDAGTTVGRLAWHLRHCKGITVVTNGISSLLTLMDAPQVEVILLGGRLRRPNEALLGSEVASALRRYRPDLAFLGADGVDAVRGINCPSHEQACIKEQMATSARQTWVLADHSKLISEPYPFWATQPPGTGIITDQATPTQAATLRQHDWDLIEVVAADG
jgi:DeoR/GlpR family transcriptional regulator of sugar metabolism